MSIPVWSAGGPPEIVSWSACGSAPIASNVVAMFAKSSAFWSATGATIAAVRASAGKKP